MDSIELYLYIICLFNTHDDHRNDDLDHGINHMQATPTSVTESTTVSGNDEDAPVIFYHTWKWGTFDRDLESHNSPLPSFIFWMFIGEGSRY